MIYFSPHPPVRQRRLNELISDGFYRELFMNPCLAGWDRGEDKHAYMGLCHRVLSRSQLNAVARLKEAGIIAHNLVVLPNTSNISLANNGTHLSLGSRRLSGLMGAGAAGFGASAEKYLGDLVLKISEHFLPLFVGTYSAAPYRLDFQDLHPEKALGFLPHELHDVHLRMIWRRWRRKAHIKFCGKSITPFGPEWLDRLVSRACGLRGDLVWDFRLLDYLVCVMSTEESPAMDGTPGNDGRLKKDLAAQGIFHPAMSLYLLHRLRPFSGYGFCGFEGRHYSQFEDVLEDMGRAADLQWLVTAAAYREALSGRTTHADIPDAPVVESERRQVIFGGAIGIPTFFVHQQSGNRFLRRILERYRRSASQPPLPGVFAGASGSLSPGPAGFFAGRGGRPGGGPAVGRHRGRPGGPPGRRIPPADSRRPPARRYSGHRRRRRPHASARRRVQWGHPNGSTAPPCAGAIWGPPWTCCAPNSRLWTAGPPGVRDAITAPCTTFSGGTTRFAGPSRPGPICWPTACPRMPPGP